MSVCSLDLRQRVVDALASGLTIAQAAERFSVGLSTVKRYRSRLKTTGSLAATPLPGRSPKIAPEQFDALRTLVASRTDWTLASLADAWQDAWQEQTGASASAVVTVSVMSDTLRRLKITYKKSVASPPSVTKISGLPFESR